MATPSLLSANELTLAFGHQRLLEGVTLAVAPGEKVGLVGRNGSGKTCLLKILEVRGALGGGDFFFERGVNALRQLRIRHRTRQDGLQQVQQLGFVLCFGHK